MIILSKILLIIMTETTTIKDYTLNVKCDMVINKHISSLVDREIPFEERFGLSGSDAYAVACGNESMIRTAFKKSVGILPKLEPTPNMLEGVRQEKMVLDMFVARTGKKLVPGPRGRLVHLKYSKLFSGSLDAYLADEPYGVEVKTHHNSSICYQGDPKHLAQIQFYMELADIEKMYYVQFKAQSDPFYDNDMLNIRIVDRDRNWWNEHERSFVTYSEKIIEYHNTAPRSYKKKEFNDKFVDELIHDLLK
jgi:hypothetical protein